MSEAELDMVLLELEPLVGVQLQKIAQLDSYTLCLRLMRSWVLLGTKPRACRLHLMVERPQALLPVPPAFCMLLRKVLLNSRLVRLSRLHGDRVVRLETQAGALVAELIDRRANLLLLDPDGILLGNLRPLRHGLELGRPYAAPDPPPGDRKARQLDRSSSSADLERFFLEQDLAEQKLALLRRVRRTLKKARKTLKKVEADLARCEDADRYRKWADLLMAQQSTLKGKGRESAQLSDLFEQGELITIPLDPRLGAVDNAQALYRKQRRLTKGLSHVQPRLDAARQKAESLEQLKSALESSSIPCPDDVALKVETLCPARGAGQGTQRKKGGGQGRLPYRLFISQDGYEILIGRGARDNHQLTFKVARGRDLWLHARDLPGCHGLVRSRGQDPIPHQTLLDAATLVAHFSRAKGGEVVEVSHTLRKNVRPAAGTPGKVYVSDTRTLRVVVETDRLARLLKS